MRKLYTDISKPGNEIKGISFYSASEGFVAFIDGLGYSSDSGRTFVKMPVTITNVDFNGYPVNLTFGFGINGVKAFNRNVLVLYGEYGLVPAILYSSNGGESFKLVYHSQYKLNEFNNGIMDVSFPENSNTGYAVDADRILKTTDQGLNWYVIKIAESSYMDHLRGIDNQTVFAFNTKKQGGRIQKTTNGGASWSVVSLPAVTNSQILAADFISGNIGWVNVADDSNGAYLYKTTNGGSSWLLQNNIVATPFISQQLRFTDENTGFALTGLYQIYKTLNSGKTWEKLARDNNFSYLGYSHNAIQCLNGNQLWAGGGHGFLELSTNGGGIPLPGAYMLIDTTGLSMTGYINLRNYSRPEYSSTWLVNGVVVGNTYNATYLHEKTSKRDTVQLIVSDGIHSDTITVYQHVFYSSVSITSFSPLSAAGYSEVMIYGNNFNGVKSVQFGGVYASEFEIISPTQIRAVTGSGSSGSVSLFSDEGTVSLAGFTFIGRPRVDLPYSIADSLVCKSEPILITLQNTETGVYYRIQDERNKIVAGAWGTGGTLPISTIPITETADFSILTARTVNSSSWDIFPRRFHITVEQTRSSFKTDKINALVGETLIFSNQSADAVSFDWHLYQDASSTSASSARVENISYASAGEKTATLISTSINGCRDTLTGKIVNIYSNTTPSAECFALNVGDDSYNDYHSTRAVINKLTVGAADNYFTSGTGNKPVLSSRIGSGAELPYDGASYVAGYTSDGILKWMAHINKSGIITAAELDEQGNLFVLGACGINEKIFLPNGDSLLISATNEDKNNLYYEKRNGFLLKMTASGNYLWHTIFDDPTKVYQGEPVQGGLPARIKIGVNQIIVSGTFLNNLDYYQNGKRNTLSRLYGSGVNYGMLRSFVLSLNLDGSLKWNVVTNNPSQDSYREFSGIGLDKNGHCYLSGFYRSQLEFSDAAGVVTTLAGKYDETRSFLMKLDGAGKLQWKVLIVNNKAFRTFSTQDLKTDDEGNAYIASNSMGFGKDRYFSIINGDGSLDSLCVGNFSLLKFNAAGKYQWGVGNTYSYYGNNFSVYLKGTDVYAMGSVSENGPLSALYEFTSTDGNYVPCRLFSSEFFIARYDTSGKLKRLVTSGDTGYQSAVSNNMVIDSKGNYLITGLLNNYQGAGNKINLFNTTLVSANYATPFLLKLNPLYCYNTTAVIANAGTDKLICKGDSVKLGGASGVGKYYWKSSDKDFSSEKSDPVVRPSATTSYYLTVVNLTGDMARDTVTVVLKDSPTANAGNDTSICINSSVVLGGNPVNGTMATWTSNPAGFTSSDFNPKVTPAVRTTYYLKAVNSSGCEGRDTVIITPASSLTSVVNITSSATGNYVCEGSLVKFSAKPINGGSKPSYQWQINNQNTGTDSSELNVTAIPGTQNVKVIMSTSLACAAPPTTTSNVIPVLVSEKLTPKVVISVSDSTICENTMVTFLSNAIFEGTDPVYQWVINGKDINENSTALFTTALKDNDSVYIRMTSNYACVTASTVKSNIIKMKVASGLPTIVISGLTQVNAGSTSLIRATVKNQGQYPAYMWLDSTASHTWKAISGSNADTINYSPISSSSQLKCEFQSTSECFNSTPITSNILKFVVNDPATPVVPPRQDTSAGISVIHYPNPVRDVLILDELVLSDKWLTVEIHTLTGSTNKVVERIGGQKKVMINTTMITPGMYIAVLRKENGESFRFNFLKL